MSYDPSNDPEFDEFVSRMDAADTLDAQEQLTKDIGARRAQTEHPVRTFAMNLPKNVGIGGYKALVNTLDTVAEVAQNVGNPAGAAVTKAVAGEEAREQFFPTLSEEYPELMGAVRNFTSEWERNDTLADDITQGVSQFTLPFMGWLKLLRGAGAATKASTVARAATAEGTTAGSAFDPHDGRVADLLELGRESDTRFGELMRKVSPDGSLMNAYIDYMTDRENEGEAEGRFKNVVDALGSSAAVAGLIKGAGIAKKTGRQILEDMGTGGGPGPRYQRGMVNFHGSPHDFDQFKLDRIGTGEGAQVYGYGLYFAQNPNVAKSYKTAGGPYLEHNGERVFAEEWDGLPVKGAVKDLIMEGSRHGLKEDGIKMFVERELKRNPERWGINNRKEQLEAIDLARQTKAVTGKFYTVDIDDAAVAQMLDYDRPLSEQGGVLAKIPEADLQKLEDMLEEGYPVNRDGQFTGSWADYTGKDLQQFIGRAIEEDRLSFVPSSYTGNPDQYAAEYFKAHGIPGLRFLDQQSRNFGRAGDQVSRKLVRHGVADWDAPVGADENLHQLMDDLYREYGSREAIEWFEKEGGKASARHAHNELLEDIKKRGTRNLVLFDDSLVKILKKE